MPTMKEIYFVSSNIKKYKEIRLTLDRYNILLKFRDATLPELQSLSLDYIALEKAKFAFKIIAKPVIIEDDGLFIHSLRGFPGPYSSYTFKTIGNKGILKLLSTSKDRRASFTSVIVYMDSNMTRHFVGKIDGRISYSLRGAGWGYDPIFVPIGSNQSFGQLGERKTLVSHRTLAVTSFAIWYHRNKSKCRTHKVLT